MWSVSARRVTIWRGALNCRNKLSSSNCSAYKNHKGSDELHMAVKAAKIETVLSTTQQNHYSFVNLKISISFLYARFPVRLIFGLFNNALTSALYRLRSKKR
jgi:hypothetical protein